jgi:hypothetical protein
MAPPIERSDRTAVAEPRPSRRGPVGEPTAHTRSRNVRMLTVSKAATTSPAVMTTDSRTIALSLPRLGASAPSSALMGTSLICSIHDERVGP